MSVNIKSHPLVIYLNYEITVLASPVEVEPAGLLVAFVIGPKPSSVIALLTRSWKLRDARRVEFIKTVASVLHKCN